MVAEAENALGEWRYLVTVRADCLGAGVELKGRLLAHGWSTREAEELCLVAVELSTNAVRHAQGGTMTVVLGPHDCLIEVIDDGPGFAPAVLEDAGQTDGTWAEGLRVPGMARPGLGSGLAAVRRLSDELTLFNRPTKGALARARRRRRTTR